MTKNITLLFAFALIVGFCVWCLLNEQGGPRTMSVALVGYTNIGEVRHAIFVTTNVRNWPVELYVGMPEIWTATGWKDAWSDRFDYRTIYQLKRGETRAFLYAVPTNKEPVRIRCLCYRSDGVGRRAWNCVVDLIGGERPSRMPDRVYSEELTN